MLDGKNSLSKKKENDIPRRIYLAQLVLFIWRGRKGEREREGEKSRIVRPKIYTNENTMGRNDVSTK